MVRIFDFFNDKEPVKTYCRKNGIRKYAAKKGVRLVHLEVKNGAFWMTVFFKNGNYTNVNFQSYAWMKAFVYNWKGATGAMLNINGSPSGICEKKNFSIM